MATIDTKFTNKNSFKDIKKLENERANFKVKCEHCGRVVTMTFTDRSICKWCGYWIYKNEKTKFKYKMKEKLRK